MVVRDCYVCMRIGFFFSKQKTAYEMRISDWSADVCSSDLLVGPHPAQDRDQRAARECGSEITNGGHPSNSSIRVMPATNAAWLSIICVDAPTMPIARA